MSDPIIRGDVRLGEGSIIQENVIIGSEEGTVIIGDEAVIYSQVRVGDRFRTSHYVLIREKTTIGDDVLIGTNSVVDGSCTIGGRVSVQTGVYITTNTTLEDDVFMGPCSVTTNDKYMVRGAELVGPVIKKGARIGANAVILPGVVVGEGAVVGAGGGGDAGCGGWGDGGGECGLFGQVNTWSCIGFETANRFELPRNSQISKGTPL